MFTQRKLSLSLVVVATLALYACTTKCTVARGGGGHGGGGHGGGHAGFHGGGNRGGHGEFNHHSYRPSQGHFAHHDGEHHDGNHGNWNHHHEGWHNGGWGPGYYGGGGWGYAGWGGFGYGDDTIINNTDNITPVSYESDNGGYADNGSDDGSNDGSDEDGDDNESNGGNNQGFATDNWPELGLSTYAGEYGASQGQVVMSVLPGSAADKAGLVAGDVILTFNGQPVPSADALETAMNTAAGKFEVTVWDARTGRKSVLDGALDPAAAPAPTKSAAITPGK